MIIFKIKHYSSKENKVNYLFSRKKDSILNGSSESDSRPAEECIVFV